MQMKTTIKDRGLKKIIKEYNKARNKEDSFVTIGLHKDATYPDGTSVGEVAFYNEYGTKSIPARPFLQLTLLTYMKEFEELHKKLLNKLLNGKANIETILKSLGFRIQAKIQNTIKQASSWADPNSASTLTRKSTGRPLIDSGTMLNSVGYQITVEKKQKSVVRGKNA